MEETEESYGGTDGGRSHGRGTGVMMQVESPSLDGTKAQSGINGGS